MKEKICVTMSHVEKTQNVFQEELITLNANADGDIKVRPKVTSGFLPEFWYFLINGSF